MVAVRSIAAAAELIAEIIVIRCVGKTCEIVRIRLTGPSPAQSAVGLQRRRPAQVGFPAISTSTTTIAASTTGQVGRRARPATRRAGRRGRGGAPRTGGPRSTSAAIAAIVVIAKALSSQPGVRRPDTRGRRASAPKTWIEDERRDDEDEVRPEGDRAQERHCSDCACAGRPRDTSTTTISPPTSTKRRQQVAEQDPVPVGGADRSAHHPAPGLKTIRTRIATSAARSSA